MVPMLSEAKLIAYTNTNTITHALRCNRPKTPTFRQYNSNNNNNADDNKQRYKTKENFIFLIIWKWRTHTI